MFKVSHSTFLEVHTPVLRTDRVVRPNTLMMTGTPAPDAKTNLSHLLALHPLLMSPSRRELKGGLVCEDNQSRSDPGVVGRVPQATLSTGCESPDKRLYRRGHVPEHHQMRLPVTDSFNFQPVYLFPDAWSESSGG